jgi:hypothetical protein
MATIIGPNAVTGVNNRGNGSDIAAFMQFLGDPATQIPLDSNFVIMFNGMPLGITKPFPGYENSNWNINATKDVLTKIMVQGTDDTPSGGRAALFVQGFNIPGEAVATSRPGSIPTGNSFLSGVVSGDRTQYGSTFSIDLLETNKSFVDFVIRPWVTLVSHYGLFTRPADSSQNVKTTVTGFLFDRYNKNALRKIYTFTGAAPVSTSGIDYKYGNNESRIERVDFVFNTFGVKDIL